MTAATTDADAVTVVVGRFDLLVGRGVVDVLREDQRLVLLAADLEDVDLERAVARLLPRVVILDEAVEHALLARLKASCPATGVLVLADDPSRLYGTVLLAAGATCVASKASHTELLAAVHHSAQGKPTFFDPDGERLTRPHGSDGLLSRRESEVLEHLSQGKSYAEIGRDLHIAPETVRTHTASICRKLNVEGKRQLIGRAARQ